MKKVLLILIAILVNVEVYSEYLKNFPIELKVSERLKVQKTEYLIISPDSLFDVAIQLKEYRQSNGLNSEVISLSNIANNQKITAEVIDSWIEEQTATNEYLKYIVLFGNTDLIPTYISVDKSQNAGIYLNGKFDSDLWYAIKGDSLNSNYLPTLMVGRIPIRDLSQAKNYVSKIKLFESNNEKQNMILFFGNKIEMSVAKGSNEPFEAGDMELAKRIGFDTISLVNPTEEELLQVLNTKPLKAIIYYGHGSFDGNLPLTKLSLTKWYNNQNPVLYFSGGCSFNDNTTGDTPIGDYLATSPNGSVVSIGASINGGYGAGYKFVDGILNYFMGKRTIGELYNSAMYYHNEFAISNTFPNDSIGNEWNYYFTRRMNFVGDPGLIINSKISPIDTTIVDISICNGESFKGHTKSSLIFEKYESSNGRDSIVKINLKVDYGCDVTDEEIIYDVDKNNYHKVNIGSQIWLTENLKTTKLNDKTNIPEVIDNLSWYNIFKPGYTWYEKNIDNKNIYGALYKWETVKSGKLCPCGWHVPSNAEWSDLIEYLGGHEIAGRKLKEDGTINWYYPNSESDNSSGFTARPGGMFNADWNNPFIYKGIKSFFWSSTKKGDNYSLLLDYNELNATLSTVYGYNGFSVRCIKDSSIPDALAIAGSNQLVNEGTMVTLDGLMSYNPKGNSLTYKWTAPNGITLSSSSVAKPTFTAPEVSKDTQFIFTLVVSDGTASSTEDQVVITVKNVNKAPVANAGIDQSVNEGSLVNLDGSLSFDPDSVNLIYKWTAPAGIVLSANNTSKPTFIAPEVKKDSVLTFTLVVNDGLIDSPPAIVKVTVKNVIKVGVEELYTSIFKVYPNPTDGIFTIESDQNSDQNLFVTVLDILGNEVYKKELEFSNKYEINLSDLVSGNYLLKVIRGKNQFLQKLIIQK